MLQNKIVGISQPHELNFQRNAVLSIAPISSGTISLRYNIPIKNVPRISEENVLNAAFGLSEQLISRTLDLSSVLEEQEVRFAGTRGPIVVNEDKLFALLSEKLDKNLPDEIKKRIATLAIFEWRTIVNNTPPQQLIPRDQIKTKVIELNQFLKKYEQESEANKYLLLNHLRDIGFQAYALTREAGTANRSLFGAVAAKSFNPGIATTDDIYHLLTQGAPFMRVDDVPFATINFTYTDQTLQESRKTFLTILSNNREHAETALRSSSFSSQAELKQFILFLQKTFSDKTTVTAQEITEAYTSYCDQRNAELNINPDGIWHFELDYFTTAIKRFYPPVSEDLFWLEEDIDMVSFSLADLTKALTSAQAERKEQTMKDTLYFIDNYKACLSKVELMLDQASPDALVAFGVDPNGLKEFGNALREFDQNSQVVQETLELIARLTSPKNYGKKYFIGEESEATIILATNLVNDPSGKNQNTTLAKEINAVVIALGLANDVRLSQTSQQALEHARLETNTIKTPSSLITNNSVQNTADPTENSELMQNQTILETITSSIRLLKIIQDIRHYQQTLPNKGLRDNIIFKNRLEVQNENKKIVQAKEFEERIRQAIKRLSIALGLDIELSQAHVTKITDQGISLYAVPGKISKTLAA
jgi:hypothetical protein